MTLSVREKNISDIEKVIDYFVNADIEFLKKMRADKHKLPERKDWIRKLKLKFKKPYSEKEFYYMIWLFDNQAIGHCNVNCIEFGESATMHLHLWNKDSRKSGLGFEFLKLCIPYFFDNLELKKLICQPKPDKIAPNKRLIKLGFKRVRTYETFPGWINFKQTVNKYELAKRKIEVGL